MPHAHLNDFWTNTCALLLVGVANAFGTVGHVQQRVKSVRRMVKRTYIERVWGCDHVRFQTEPNVRIWLFFKTVRRFFFFLCFSGHGSSLSYSSFSMWTSRGCGCIYFLCLCFCFRASLLTLSSLLVWQFWHRNNETASAATALRMINLRKYTQLLVSRIFQLHY